MTAQLFSPSGPLRGALDTAADKSLSHRSALFAAMADGRSRIDNYLLAEDTLSTLSVVEQIGAGVSRRGDSVEIEGVGLRGAGSADRALDAGNSGTLIRLMMGWLAGQPRGEWTLDGDDSIRSRPMARVADPLGELGASIALTDGRAPLTVSGRELHGAALTSPVASAQVKSAILLAGLNAAGTTSVTEPTASRDHTERMLAEQGAEISISDEGDGHTVTVEPCEVLTPIDRVVPGDPSSAAFPLLAAVLVPGSEVTVRNVNLNPLRTGFLRILERMGADLPGLPAAGVLDPLGQESTGDLTARHSPLRGVAVEGAEVPSAVDELTLVGLAACFADGETVVRGASELRVKETDRIARLVEILTGLGADAEAFEDGFAVRGSGSLRGGSIESHGDHRLAMLGAVAGLASEQGVEVRGFEAAAVSYPAFADDIASLA